MRYLDLTGLQNKDTDKKTKRQKDKKTGSAKISDQMIITRIIFT